MFSVYLASPLSQARACCDLAEDLLDLQIVTCSQWHAAVVAAAAVRDPESDQTRRELLTLNLADIERADALVALVHIGEPRATLGEIGYALALRKPVVWVSHGWRGRNLLDAHVGVTRIDVADDSTRRTLAARVARALAPVAVRRAS